MTAQEKFNEMEKTILDRIKECESEIDSYANFTGKSTDYKVGYLHGLKNSLLIGLLKFKLYDRIENLRN